MGIRFLLFLFISTSLGVFAQEPLITIEDLYTNGRYSAKGVSGLRSMNDGKHYTIIKKREKGQFIEKYEYKSGKKIEDIVTPTHLAVGKKEITIADYHFNSDESQILIETDQETVYRYSTKGVYYLLNREYGKLRQVSTGGKASHCTFSPNGDRVAYVFENNLYHAALEGRDKVKVTKTGKKNEVINGMADWVYEEEFAFTKAFEWSPDGKYIAFYEFDESEVKEYDMPMYLGGAYPEHDKFKYPKAGETNAKVRILIHNLETKENKVVNVGSEVDQYIPRIKWTKRPGKLLVQRMNRLQNRLDLMLVNAEDGSSEVFHSEVSETYIDITDNFHFLSNGDDFIWTSEVSGFNHIYLMNLNGKTINSVTTGNWDVTSFYGVDEANGKIYFQSSKEGPTRKAVYETGLDGKGLRKMSKRVGQNGAKFSKSFEYHINTWSDANTPPFVSLVHTKKGKEIRVLESNEALVKTLEDVKAPAKEFFSFDANGTKLNGWMIKPNGFSKEKKHPVLMFVYGGPGSNTVNDSWGHSNHIWHMHLAQLGYVVVSVDNRGTGNRGRDFKHMTYKELGKFETEDQIAAAQYLGTLPFVDPERIGIQGWSYGGYMASLCMTKGAKYFKAGIAVAPVTNWRWYDTIYTERFMRTPKENANGYDDNSPINHVEKLEGSYLLVHGGADDNVHLQNTMEMITALVDANKQFDLFVYPNKNHGIYGGNTRYHLFTKMTNFLKENL